MRKATSKRKARKAPGCRGCAARDEEIRFLRRLVSTKVMPGGADALATFFAEVEDEKRDDAHAEKAPAEGALHRDTVLSAFRQLYGPSMGGDALPPWLRGRTNGSAEAATDDPEADEPAPA